MNENAVCKKMDQVICITDELEKKYILYNQSKKEVFDYRGYHIEVMPKEKGEIDEKNNMVKLRETIAVFLYKKEKDSDKLIPVPISSSDEPTKDEMLVYRDCINTVFTKYMEKRKEKEE